MGKKRKRRSIFTKKKRSLFSRPHPMRRKIILQNRKMKAFFHKHNPKVIIHRGMKRMVGRIYTVSDKVLDKMAENNMALDNPFSVQFYQDRCTIQ
ncbi:DNA-binding protein [Operophtera brumata]|uniref:DNA-binding protein n=1 Tax=Operophtera brumata TaxID=104452 RepID=A0A0L7KTI2_OPEBR|nr:DNA-binding protein [Operophtera brumata]